MTDDKVFFKPGDVVELRLSDLMASPRMLVIRKESNLVNKLNGIDLRGIRCRWFTTDGMIQEAVFSTKDLLLVK